MIHKTAVRGSPGFVFSHEKDGIRVLQESIYKPLIHESVFIGSFTNVDSGTYRNTAIGEGTIIDSHGHISHDVIIGKNCEIDAGAIILGEVELDDYCRVGAGAIIHPKVKMGTGSVLGANSYLRDNTLGGCIYYGTPAKRKFNTNYEKVRDKPWIKKKL